LYLFQTQSHYQSTDDRAVAISALLQQRDETTVRTFRKQTLQHVTDSLNVVRKGIGSTTRGIPPRSQARPAGPAHSTSRSDANIPTRGSNVPTGSQRSTGERIICLRAQLPVVMAAHVVSQAAIPLALAAYNTAMAAATECRIDNSAAEANALEAGLTRITDAN
jgi:hypothetical protein